MAALEHSSSQNLDLADWPVWRNATGRTGPDPGVAKKSKQPFGATSSRTSGQGAIPAVHAMCRQRPLWPMSGRRVPFSIVRFGVTTRRSSAKSKLAAPGPPTRAPSAIETARFVTCRDTTKCLRTGGNGPCSPCADEVAVGESIRSGERSAAITPALVERHRKKTPGTRCRNWQGVPGGLMDVPVKRRLRLPSRRRVPCRDRVRH
jgi:hypothetical protein